VASRLLVCICALFLLLCVGTAFGDGTYQRTKDGKTTVWNDNPKPGDSAIWVGDRDAEGFATNTGTLTWYTASGALYARFVGNMVHGKFDGAVTGYSKGRTGHALFSDGQRTTRWAAGNAASSSLPSTPTVRPPEKVAETNKVPHPPPASEHGKPGSITLIKAPSSKAVAAKTDRPVPMPAYPDFRDSLPNNETIRKRSAPSGTANAAASNSSRQPGTSASAAATVTKPEIAAERNDGPQKETPEIAVEREDAKRATPEPPAEGPPLVPTPAAVETPSSSSGERTPAPEEQRFNEEEIRQPPQSTAPSENQPISNTPPISDKKTDVDVSVPTIVQPASPPHLIHDRPAASQANPHLTIEEVIRIANTEARRRGYNRADYEKEEPVFHPDHKTWSVLYEQSATDAVAGGAKPFTVIVDDRTKGAMLVRRR
jgi:hypothetical protein